MRKEQNGHVYDTERSIVIGTHKYADRQRGNEIVTEKLYQTVSGQYFIFGQGGMYVHTEGNFWSRRKVDWMILPKEKHFAETWLRDHCSRGLGEKNGDVYIHPLITSGAKAQLLKMAKAEGCGIGEIIERLVEKC